MAIKNLDLKFEDSVKIARFFAYKYSRRANALGLNISYDDIYSEIQMVWVQCRNAFDPERGVKFSTYFTNALNFSWSSISSKNVDKVLIYAQTEIISDDGEEKSVLDTIVDSSMGPEEKLILQDNLTKLQSIAPIFSTFAKLSVSPPQELMDQLEALKAQYEFAKERNIALEPPPIDISPRLLVHMFKLNWRYRQRLTEEMERIVGHV